MIAASIIGVAVATVLLVVGLIRGATALFVSSIAVSVVAACALLLGVRRLPAAQVPKEDPEVGLTLRPVGRATVPVQAPPPDPVAAPQPVQREEAVTREGPGPMPEPKEHEASVDDRAREDSVGEG